MILRPRVSLLFTVAFLLITMMACSSSGGNSSPSPTPTPSLQSITVSPTAPSIIAGNTEQYSATGNYSDGSTQNLTSSATWTSSNTTVATVSAAGLATTLTEGAATIAASLQSITGSTSLTATALTVQVSVVASDSAGHPLTYLWQSTDGTIQDVNAATTTWTLPDGPGLHFAYVLVSNGFGGYTEQRVAVNTDTIGTPLILPTPVPFTPPPPFSLTPATIFRGFLTGGVLSTVSSFPGAGSNWNPGIPVSVPDIPVVATDDVVFKTYPPVSANVRGELVFPLTSSDAFIGSCISLPGIGAADPHECINALAEPVAGLSISGYGNPVFNPFLFALPPPVNDIAGEVLLQDGSACGIVDEFFGVEVVATATLLDGSGNILAGPVRANQWGDYDLPYETGAASVSLQCENNSPIVISIPTVQTPTTEIAAVTVPASAPTVTSMTAALNGTQISQLQPSSPAPSDIVPLGDAFLAEKGLDSRIGACQYYKAVGAVKSCDAAGNFSGAINFEDWKSQVQIDQYAPTTNTNLYSTPVYTATYINKVDLNLARVHHSVSNGLPPANSNILNTAPYTFVANYVCNHTGPGVSPSQQVIDSVIQNTVNGQNLVACVAMDYSTFPVLDSSTGTTSHLPTFIRFLIFGPSGQLLPSVNLDGRREKFVPGTCVVCHGGDNYAGKYPEDGSGNTDLGAHFLPYDTGNFEFSSQAGLTDADQEPAIFNLNQIIMSLSNPAANQGITQAEATLINGWYSNSNGSPGPPINQSYVDPSWQAAGTAAVSVYQNVYARSCRTCHVALPNYNFEQYPLFNMSGPVVDPVNCGGSGGVGGGLDRNRMYKMPNSLATFNLFWGSHNSTTEFDQVTAFHQFLNCLDNASANAVPAHGVHKR
jgi:hypothetical protein